MENEERTWEETTFPDGSPFADYVHGETGAVTYKVQHPEFELWSLGVQARNRAILERAAVAMTDMLDATLEARAAGVEEDRLAEVLRLQRKVMWRLDSVSSENSGGFHADQEAARILGESIDYSRRAQTLALRLRAPQTPSIDSLPKQPVEGVTPEKR